MTEAKEQRVAGIGGMYVANIHPVEFAAVDGFECDGRAVGIIDREVAHRDMVEAAAAGRAEVEGACAAPDLTMSDVDIVATVVTVLRFETDAVVVGIEEATRHLYIFAVDDIDAIVVPHGIAFDGDAVDGHIATAC